MLGRLILRTCVGCRTVREQRALVRVSADASGGLAVNSPRARGRGAYLCPSHGCLDLAWQRKAFSRALRQELPGLNRAEVHERFEAEVRRRGTLVT